MLWWACVCIIIIIFVYHTIIAGSDSIRSTQANVPSPSFPSPTQAPRPSYNQSITPFSLPRPAPLGTTLRPFRNCPAMDSHPAPFPFHAPHRLQPCVPLPQRSTSAPMTYLSGRGSGSRQCWPGCVRRSDPRRFVETP